MPETIETAGHDPDGALTGAIQPTPEDMLGLELPDEEPEPESKESEPEKAKPAKPDEAAEEVPWDKAKQQADQRQANEHKATLKLLESLTARLEAIETGNQPGKQTLEEALSALSTLEPPEAPDEFSTDEETATFRKDMAQYRKDVARCNKAVASAAKAPKEPKADKQDEEPKGASQADYRAVLDACDEAYGADLRAAANQKVQGIFKDRGFSKGNIPSKQQIEDIALRVYADLRRETDSKARPAKKAVAKSDRKDVERVKAVSLNEAKAEAIALLQRQQRRAAG